MKTKNLWSILMLAMLMVGAVASLSSCSKDDDDSPAAIVVKNNSTFSLERFRVVFLNSREEKLADRDFGTFEPGASVTAEIPTGATEYYLATYMYNNWFFSPNYEITYTSLKLSTSEINNWATNSYAPKKVSAFREE